MCVHTHVCDRVLTQGRFLINHYGMNEHINVKKLEKAKSFQSDRIRREVQTYLSLVCDVREIDKYY